VKNQKIEMIFAHNPRVKVLQKDIERVKMRRSLISDFPAECCQKIEMNLNPRNCDAGGKSGSAVYNPLSGCYYYVSGSSDSTGNKKPAPPVANLCHPARQQIHMHIMRVSSGSASRMGRIQPGQYIGPFQNETQGNYDLLSGPVQQCKEKSASAVSAHHHCEVC
jgi:hypothetical protein